MLILIRPWKKAQMNTLSKLIRQYIPKKSNFNYFTDMQINQIQHKFNKRPKKMNFDIPAKVFTKFVS